MLAANTPAVDDTRDHIGKLKAQSLDPQHRPLTPVAFQVQEQDSIEEARKYLGRFGLSGKHNPKPKIPLQSNTRLNHSLTPQTPYSQNAFKHCSLNLEALNPGNEPGDTQTLQLEP